MSAPPLSRLEESLLAIDTDIKELKCFILRLATALRVDVAADDPERITLDVEDQEAPADPAPVHGRQSWESIDRDDRHRRILAAVEHGPLTLTQIARVVYRVERVLDTQTSKLHPFLHRMIRDGLLVSVGPRKYGLPEKRSSHLDLR